MIPEGFIMSREDAEYKLKRGWRQSLYNFFTRNNARYLFALDFRKTLTEIGEWLDHLYAQDTESKNLEDVQNQWRGLIYRVTNYLNERLNFYQPGSHVIKYIQTQNDGEKQSLTTNSLSDEIVKDLQKLMTQTTDQGRGGWKSWEAAYAFLDARSQQLEQGSIAKQLKLLCLKSSENETKTAFVSTTSEQEKENGTQIDFNPDLYTSTNTSSVRLPRGTIETVLNHPKIENLERLREIFQQRPDCIKLAPTCSNTKPFVNQIKSLIDQTKKLHRCIDKIIDYV